MSKYKIVFLKQGSQEWLDWRNRGIGGSDISTLLNPSEESSQQLIYHKLFGKSFNFSEVTRAAMERGHLLEPEARAEFIRRSGIEVTPYCIQSLGNPFMRVSLDGISRNFKTVAEIKCLGLTTHDKVVKTGQISDRYYDQIQYQMLVTGARRAFYVGWNPDSECPYFQKLILPDYKRMADIQEAIKRFQDQYYQYRALPNIVIVCGYAGAGKDSVGNYFKYTLGYDHDYFAKPLITWAIDEGLLPEDYTYEQKAAIRPQLVARGKQLREEDPDYFVRNIINRNITPNTLWSDKHIVITDGRYTNEVIGLSDFASDNNLSFLSLWVNGHVPPHNEEEAKKTSLVKPLCHYDVDNPHNGLNELHKKLTAIVNRYGV